MSTRDCFDVDPPAPELEPDHGIAAGPIIAATLFAALLAWNGWLTEALVTLQLAERPDLGERIVDGVTERRLSSLEAGRKEHWRTIIDESQRTKATLRDHGLLIKALLEAQK